MIGGFLNPPTNPHVAVGLGCDWTQSSLSLAHSPALLRATRHTHAHTHTNTHTNTLQGTCALNSSRTFKQHHMLQWQLTVDSSKGKKDQSGGIQIGCRLRRHICVFIFLQWRHRGRDARVETKSIEIGLSCLPLRCSTSIGKTNGERCRRGIKQSVCASGNREAMAYLHHDTLSIG